MPGIELRYTKGEVNRAGQLLADNINGLHSAEYAETREIVQHYRSCHAYPMTKVAMGVRSMASTEVRRPVLVGQRLKRFPQIVHKLTRQPGMNLARMQDIGGCRALLDNREQVERVADRIRRRWKIPPNRIRNYMDHPQATGYRAVHLVTERDGRLIEVQLRTPGQQRWAMNVEELAKRTGWNLKDGDGPEGVLKYYRLAAEAMSDAEEGREVLPEALAEMIELLHEAGLLEEEGGA